MAKIMLVEDDNNLREIYEARLQAEGYEIVSAKDGEEALAMAIKERPDLIISDIMMPKISGFDMLDILRSTTETKNTKVVMMTALGQAEDKARADKLGADRYLVKSQVTLEDVARVVHEELGDGTPAAAAPATAGTPTAIPVTPAPAPTAPAALSAMPVTPAPTPAPGATPPTVTEMPVAEPPVSPAPTEPPATPAPAADPVPTPPVPEQPAPASPPSPSAQSAQQEQDVVKAQIEQFVNQPAPVPEAATPAPEPSTPVAVEAPPANPAPETSAPSTEPAVSASSSSPEIITPNAPLEAAPEPAPMPKPATQTQSTSHTLVLQPISDMSNKGPDLNALLAAEEKKQAATMPPTGAVLTPGDAPTTPPPEPPIPAAPSPSTPPGEVLTPASDAGTPPANDTTDPNSIAL